MPTNKTKRSAKKQKEWPEDCIAMPREISINNAVTENCDMAAGPCACGAWHRRSEWMYDSKRKMYPARTRATFRKIVRIVDQLFNTKELESK